MKHQADTTGHNTAPSHNAESIPVEMSMGERLMELLPLTFKRQAMLFLLPTIIIISAVYTLESISTERRILRSEIIKKGETIATIAAKTAELSILSENLEQLKISAATVMAIKDVASVSFFNNRAELLHHAGGKYRLTIPLEPAATEQPVFREHADIIEFVVPVVTLKASEGLFLLDESTSAPAVREQIGWVRVGLSKRVMSLSEREIILRGSILAVLFSVAGLLLLYLLITLATRPLYALINAVKNVREGEHSEVEVTFPVSEIGMLATEFNRMSRSIREREDQLQENIAELEQSQEQLQDSVQEMEIQIEARKSAEAQLIEHRNNLEDLVRSRTTQLTIAKDQAEAASRAKSDFLSSMSHELRTPLNAILGYAQILKRQPNLTETQQHQLEIVRSSGEHLLTLINDILDVSKIEARKMEINRHTFDLPGLLRQVHSLTKLQAEEKELRFVFEPLTEIPPFVLGDERKLRQILLNLLSNAVKYTNRGGVTLTISYESRAGGILRCEVNDTGIGIPADQLEAIFEPFTQVAESRQVREGTGLGLNITRQLLTLMQGSIGVESTPGTGSRFWIELPLPAVNGQEARPASEKPRIAGYSGPVRRILVVDDNINNSSLLLSLLEPFGFEVATAESGVAALLKIPEFRPHLVIMDLVMPGQDGLACAREIRSMAGCASVKIIGASATVTDSDNKGAFVAVCDAFVPKPIRIDLLLEQIGELLGLDWKRSPSLLPAATAVPRAQASGADTELLPLDQLRTAHELALRGDMRRLLQWTIEMDKQYPNCTAFIRRVRELAASYRTKGVLSLLNEQVGMGAPDTHPEHGDKDLQ